MKKRILGLFMAVMFAVSSVGNTAYAAGVEVAEDAAIIETIAEAEESETEESEAEEDDSESEIIPKEEVTEEADITEANGVDEEQPVDEEQLEVHGTEADGMTEETAIDITALNSKYEAKLTSDNYNSVETEFGKKYVYERFFKFTPKETKIYDFVGQMGYSVREYSKVYLYTKNQTKSMKSLL